MIASPESEGLLEASRAVFAVFERHTDVVEPGSMEEAFLDVSACAAPAPSIAAALRREVRDEVGLALSVGVTRTKVLAKLASREAKPDGLFVVEPGREVEFLHPLPVERLWGVGRATASKLRGCGDLEAAVSDLAERLCGRMKGRAARPAPRLATASGVW